MAPSAGAWKERRRWHCEVKKFKLESRRISKADCHGEQCSRGRRGCRQCEASRRSSLISVGEVPGAGSKLLGGWNVTTKNRRSCLVCSASAIRFITHSTVVAMPSIGPTLPPHLSKRSRDEAQDDGASSPDSSEKRRRVAGPALPPTASTSARAVGPSLPPDFTSRASSSESESVPAPPTSSRPSRVAGPAPPPAPLDERPQSPPADDSDSSDDDFGPAPPPVGGVHHAGHDDGSLRPTKSAFDTEPQFTDQPKRAQRDEWMTLPPTQDDLSARMDPTKMRARKFNSGKSAGGTSGMSSAWTETPEQKLKRLQDEALGITAPSNAAPATSESRKSKDEERRARKMREKIDAARGKSLVEQHQDKGTGKEKEDDPSKRAFDYEKDMAVSGTVNHKQRREMLSKSKGFSDRFSSGSFL